MTEPWWHGTPDVRNLRGAAYGVHVGTERAAREALHARIGQPLEGEWDGTREYGKTLLRTVHKGVTDRSGNPVPDEGRLPKLATYHEPQRQPGGGIKDGPPTRWEDRDPKKRYNERGAVYSDGSPVPMDARPSLFPVHITGSMTNSIHTPHEDWKANGYMKGQIKQGRAKRGYYYRNISEDEGSISAVVPNADHLRQIFNDRRR